MPLAYSYETFEGKDYYALITEMLGPNLLDLFLHCNKAFKLSTVTLLGLQMLGGLG